MTSTINRQTTTLLLLLRLRNGYCLHDATIASAATVGLAAFTQPHTGSS